MDDSAANTTRDVSVPVSYTHLDVYKRQRYLSLLKVPHKETDFTMKTFANIFNVQDPIAENKEILLI